MTVEIAKEHMGLLSTLFALMANTSSNTGTDQVDNECSASHSKCFNCVYMESKVLPYQNHNSSLISDLNQCIDANKVLKSNEKDFQSKIELLNRQLHEAEIVVLNKQDAITFYLNNINEMKKKLAIVECDYETLAQKLKSYESSSYVIEHMISKGTDHQGTGKESYQRCPPPILNSFFNTPDDKDVKDFQEKIPLVIDPIGLITDEGSSLLEDSFVEGIVEDWVSDSEDEYDNSSDHVATQNPPSVQMFVISESKTNQTHLHNWNLFSDQNDNSCWKSKYMAAYKSVSKHNICTHLDLETPNARHYTEILTFLRPDIDCRVEPPVIRGKVLGHDVVVSAEHIRRVCGFQDSHDQPTLLD
ncbi:hypothetical protein R6Q57_018644 [Mikania cordata]